MDGATRDACRARGRGPAFHHFLVARPFSYRGTALVDVGERAGRVELSSGDGLPGQLPHGHLWSSGRHEGRHGGFALLSLYHLAELNKIG